MELSDLPHGIDGRVAVHVLDGHRFAVHVRPAGRLEVGARVQIEVAPRGGIYAAHVDDPRPARRQFDLGPLQLVSGILCKCVTLQ